VALKISLKPNERVFIGGAVVQNGDSHVELNILNDVPLLREKDILNEQEADSVCKQIYLCVQLMYMDQTNLRSYQQNYRNLIEEIINAAPSTSIYLGEMNNHLACGRYYQALKSARGLMEYEQGLINHAQQCT
jgi:flagellar protein FlbT